MPDKNKPTELENMKAELELAQQQATEHLAGWQRARADYSNLKKEQEKMQQEALSWANAAMMAEILPIYNHLKLAIKHIPEDQLSLDWVKGIVQIAKQYQDFLKKYQIEEIKTVGEKFDHNIHEAVVHEKIEGVEPDVVFEEISPGYLLGEQVLNPAKVKVAK